MYEKKVVIVAPHGLHTRPLSTFVKEAKQFISDINIISDGMKASAKSLFKLQTLNLSKDTEITIVAEGEDEEIAVKRLIELLNTLE